MAIEISCTVCGTLLRVGDENAGAQARCPSCENVFQIPLDAAPAPAAPMAGDPFVGGGTANPFESPVGVAGRANYLKPHRGALILTFGILGFLCCPFFGPAAWIMGHGDMKQIDAGVMDPEGRGLTQAGKIVGIIATILGFLGLIIQIAMIAFGFAGAAQGM